MTAVQELIDYLIQEEITREIVWKELHTKLHMSEQCVGDSNLLFHLKTLKELVEIESGGKVKKLSLTSKLLIYLIKKTLIKK